jgi:signal recognition particle receptor subunit beta
MPYLNPATREISFKIVYYGPALSGKTTSLLHIHKVLSDDIKGQVVILDTEEERTLFFDFFPVYLGTIEGFKLRFNIYTVPGQVIYEASRKLIVNGADAVVFVADSQPARLEENFQSWQSLVLNLRAGNMDVAAFPVVLQYNKRDLEPRIEVGTIEHKFGLNGIPVFETSATKGVGVMDALKKVSIMMIERFSTKNLS